MLQADVGTDETGKLVGRDLAETLEACNLRIGTQFLNGLQALFLAIAVAGDEVALFSQNLLIANLGALVTHSEEGGLQHIDVSLLDELGEELQEEGDDEQSDVHAIDVGIGGYYHLIIS